MPINRVKKRGQTRIEVRKRWPDGTEYRRFLANSTLAKQVLARIEGSIATGTWREFRESLLRGPEVKVISFSELADQFLEEYAKVRCRSWNRYELSLGKLCDQLGTIGVDAFTRHDLHNYVQKRSREVSPASVNRDIACAKKLFSYAFEIGIVEHHPLFRFPLLAEREKARRILTVEEFHLLVDQMPNTVLSAYVAILGETGLRKSEALHLEWVHIDLRERLVLPDKTKSNKVRAIPLSDYAVEWLSKLVRYINCPYVFVNPDTGKRLVSPDQTFRRNAKKAGFPGLGFHDLRVFRATQWHRLGVHLKTIQQMLGHADIKTTMRYYVQRRVMCSCFAKCLPLKSFLFSYCA